MKEPPEDISPEIDPDEKAARHLPDETSYLDSHSMHWLREILRQLGIFLIVEGITATI